MQLFALLLIAVLDYASSDPAHCYVTFMESKMDNPYFDVTLDENFYVETLEVLKDITSEDGLKIIYDVVNQQAIDTDEEAIDLCDPSPSASDAVLLEILKQSLGLHDRGCPIEKTIIKKPPTFYECQYDFGVTKDSANFLDFKIMKDDESMYDVSISIIKPEDDHTSEEK